MNRRQQWPQGDGQLLYDYPISDMTILYVFCFEMNNVIFASVPRLHSRKADRNTQRRSSRSPVAHRLFRPLAGYSSGFRY